MHAPQLQNDHYRQVGCGQEHPAAALRGRRVQSAESDHRHRLPLQEGAAQRHYLQPGAVGLSRPGALPHYCLQLLHSLQGSSRRIRPHRRGLPQRCQDLAAAAGPALRKRDTQTAPRQYVRPAHSCQIGRTALAVQGAHRRAEGGVQLPFLRSERALGVKHQRGLRVPDQGDLRAQQDHQRGVQNKRSQAHQDEVGLEQRGEEEGEEMLLMDGMPFNWMFWRGVEVGKVAGLNFGVFLEYYNSLVLEMGNFMEKNDEVNKIEEDRHEERQKRGGSEYRKEETSKILNRFVNRRDGKQELSIVYESDEMSSVMTSLDEMSSTFDTDQLRSVLDLRRICQPQPEQPQTDMQVARRSALTPKELLFFLNQLKPQSL